MRFLIVGNIMSIKHQMQVFPLSQGPREKRGNNMFCFFLHVLPPDACWCLFWCFLAEIFSLCLICFICFIVVSLLFHCCCICFSYLACLFHVLFSICFHFCCIFFHFFIWKPLPIPDHWHDHHLVLLIHGPLGDESPWAVWFLILQLLLETCIQAAHRKSSLKMPFFSTVCLWFACNRIF